MTYVSTGDGGGDREGDKWGRTESKMSARRGGTGSSGTANICQYVAKLAAASAGTTHIMTVLPLHRIGAYAWNPS